MESNILEQSFDIPATTQFEVRPPSKNEPKMESNIPEQSFDIPKTTQLEISLKSKATTSSSDDFSGYSESDIPQYNKHNQRVRGPFGVVPEKTIPNLPIEFDEPIRWDEPVRQLMDSMVPCIFHVNNIVARPLFKVFTTPSLNIASDDFPTSLHLDRTHINITAPKLNAAIICVVNMFVYAIRELFLVIL